MKRHFIGALMSLVFSLSLALSSIVLAVPDTWTKKTDMPTARYGLSTSAVNRKIYAIGGVNTNRNNYLSIVEEYDLVLDIWTTKRDMPTARFGLSTSVVNGRIYAIGGGGNVNNGFISTVEEYDPVSDKWTKKAKIPTARNHLSTSTVNGKIYAIGGDIWDWVNLITASTVEEYDPAVDKWRKKADMPTARDGLSTSAVNGKIYAIGGAGVNSVLSTVEEYDPASDTWIKKADMPTARYSLSTSAMNGKIYAIGGYNGGFLSTVEEYDPASDTWTKKADMPIAWAYSFASSVSGKIYAIGGMNLSGDFSIVEEYDTGFAGEGVEAKGKLATEWGKLKGDER